MSGINPLPLYETLYTNTAHTRHTGGLEVYMQGFPTSHLSMARKVSICGDNTANFFTAFSGAGAIVPVS
jgi:hypothetical protein